MSEPEMTGLCTCAGDDPTCTQCAGDVAKLRKLHAAWLKPGGTWAFEELRSEVIIALPTFLTAYEQAASMREALTDLVNCAGQLPKKTPAAGSCVTEHQFTIEAGVIWALDKSTQRARAALKGPTA